MIWESFYLGSILGSPIFVNPHVDENKTVSTSLTVLVLCWGVGSLQSVMEVRVGRGVLCS